MKNVLILASGQMAQHFVKWVSKSRIDTNEYTITCSEKSVAGEMTTVDNINYINIDPSSLIRVKNIMNHKDFSTIFIVLDDKEEALSVYENVRIIAPKTFIVFVSHWNDISFDDSNLNVLNVNEIMISNLYEKLPNVPLIAKNIGLGKGEIMEVILPFGSSFTYKHIGSIEHRKWKIVALYRKEKQIFVNASTMLYPNDRLIIIGNPLVLEEVYKRVNLRQGLFPEPVGKNIYLLINTQQDTQEILIQVNEAIYLSKQLNKIDLHIRLIYANDFELIAKIRKLKPENIKINVMVTYRDENIFNDIDFDISKYDIGLFMLDRKCFFKKKLKTHLIGYRKNIYLFGEKSLYNIEEALMLMGEARMMESISASIFDFSESLGLKFTLCNYSPDGDFQEGKEIVEHYETLSRIYNFKVNFEKKQVNPIRELSRLDGVLIVSPLQEELKQLSLFNFFSIRHDAYILSIKKHPQLLIPVGN